jgi:hypothetical protein
MPTTTNLNITHLEQNQAQPHVTINEAFNAFDKAVAGYLSKSLASGDVTLTTDEGRSAIVELTGTLTANRNLIVPAKTKIYFVANSTTGAFTATVKTAAGTGVTVAQGTRALVFCDGTNVWPGFSTATFGASGAGHSAGLVPTPGASAGAAKFLREDATWALPAGGSFVGAKATRNSNYTTSDSTHTAVPLTAEDFDSDNFHDNSTNPSRITVPTGLGGKYLVTGLITFNTGGGTRRIARLYKNGTSGTAIASVDQPLGASGYWSTTLAAVVDLAAGDYVEISGWQNSGGTLDIYADANIKTELTVVRLGS